ncbi:MAG: nucleoside monophosphate kinase [bacterium]
MKPQAFIFIGRSGSGKGTQAKLLTDYLRELDPTKKTLYIQSGSEFRHFVKGESETQILAKEVNDQGGLQPEFLAVYMWTNVLVNQYTRNEHLIFDGTPRKLHEAGVLDSIFDFYKTEKPHVICLKVSEDWSVRHLMVRGREDDNEALIRERLSWFEAEVRGAIEYYRTSPRYHFIEIDGEQTVQEVHKELVKKIGK